MPALPSVPKVLRLDHYFDIAEDLTAKTRAFWQYVTGPPTDADLATMATALRAAFATDVASLLSEFWSLGNIIITDLTSPTSAVGSDTGTTAGTRSGSSNSASNAVLESRHIARRYRGGHSRIYWPFGVNGDFQTAQTWKTTFTADVLTGLTSYGTAIEAAIAAFGGSSSPVNVSYYEGFTTHTGTTGRVRNVSTVRLVPLVDIVVGHTIQTGVASVRKRLLRLA